jgi:hypothetical protein
MKTHAKMKTEHKVKTAVKTETEAKEKCDPSNDPKDVQVKSHVHP